MKLKSKLFSLPLILIISFLIILQSQAMLEVPNFFRENTSLAFEYITKEQGLSNLSVSAMVEDKHGFLWFATQGVLNFYDGKKIEVIRNNPFKDNGLIHNLIQTIYYDKN